MKMTVTDLLLHGRNKDLFVGRPFALDYNNAHVLLSDSDKQRVNGVAQGSFLLAFYDNEETVEEAILLRALNPAKLPTDSAMVSSMIEYYKDNLPTSGKQTKLDDFTRYEFSFSGLACRVLGTFYRNGKGVVEFGADLENFYSAHHYSVYKVNKDVLGYIVNQRDSADIIPGNDNEFAIGEVRYSSSLRFQVKEEKARVYINPADLLGKRTALFGMTRTGKSNTVKKIIEATVQISGKAKETLPGNNKNPQANLQPFDSSGSPRFPVGQIIFDINGEYANANLQDEGTAIYEMYKQQVTRYSVLEKPGFQVMKVNFYKQLTTGFELIKSYLADDNVDYVKSFLSIDLTRPEDESDESAMTRWRRKASAYVCCLYAAGFPLPKDFTKVNFDGQKELNKLVREDGSLSPTADTGTSIDDAITWFTTIWDNYNSEFFTKYKTRKGKEWADEDLKALLVFLTKKRTPGGATNISGYLKLRGLIEQHTATADTAFQLDIVQKLRTGKIVIIDLSQGNPQIQIMYSEMICQHIFNHSMNTFIKNEPNNFIQFYFEEAHNLFPKKEDKDLSQIYNRIAKEGAKINLGMIYATQEVSSISSNILKNTQNWFIAHLNNEDEIRELRKYYDFDDFADALIRFSAKNDKGFVRMKTYSNPFVVPVQIDKFLVPPVKA
jgi:DNA helicase HerA-like ATPase